MIRKREMEKIKLFCEKNNLIHMHEFIDVKHMDADMSNHIVTLKRGGVDVITLEKRTYYDFNCDTISIIWVTIDINDVEGYCDNINMSLEYIKRKVENNVAKENWKN